MHDIAAAREGIAEWQFHIEGASAQPEMLIADGNRTSIRRHRENNKGQVDVIRGRVGDRRAAVDPVAIDARLLLPAQAQRRQDPQHKLLLDRLLRLAAISYRDREVEFACVVWLTMQQAMVIE